MAYSPQDLLHSLNRDFIMGNATVEEQISFIEDQIRDPFDSGNDNYFKKLARMVESKDRLDEICAQFITQIQDVYPGLTIDLSEYEQHTERLFTTIYKFFIKNASKIMYVFIREFLFNNKNRRVITDEFNSSKITGYSKEQYGKKEFYILMIKLPQIVDSIFEDGYKLKKFVEFVDHGEDSPIYLDQMLKAIEEGWVIDNGVVEEMYRLFKRSEQYNRRMNQLEIDINRALIIPYLKENGLMDVRLPAVEEIQEDLDENDDEEEDE